MERAGYPEFNDPTCKDDFFDFFVECGKTEKGRDDLIYILKKACTIGYPEERRRVIRKIEKLDRKLFYRRELALELHQLKEELKALKACNNKCNKYRIYLYMKFNNLTPYQCEKRRDGEYPFYSESTLKRINKEFSTKKPLFDLPEKQIFVSNQYKKYVALKESELDLVYFVDNACDKCLQREIDGLLDELIADIETGKPAKLAKDDIRRKLFAYELSILVLEGEIENKKKAIEEEKALKKQYFSEFVALGVEQENVSFSEE